MRDDRERVLDIIEAIERIEKVSVRGRDYFYDDEMAQVWVIHHLQIIGEYGGSLRNSGPQTRVSRGRILSG